MSETSFPKPSVSWQKRRRRLCAPSWQEARTKGPRRPNFLTVHDCENQAPPQGAHASKCLPWRYMRPPPAISVTGAACLETAMLEAFKVGTLLMEFMNLLLSEGHGAWESLETVGKRPLLFSHFLAVGGELISSELPSPQLFPLIRLNPCPPVHFGYSSAPPSQKKKSMTPGSLGPRDAPPGLCAGEWSAGFRGNQTLCRLAAWRH